MTIRESETSFGRCGVATTTRKLDLFVRFNVEKIEGFDIRRDAPIVVVVVVWDSFAMDIVDVVNIESNIVSCTRRVNGNSPRLQNKPV